MPGRSELLQVILQEADFNAATGDALGLCFTRRDWGIAHADQINPVDGNVVVQRQVADDRLSHLLRSRDGHLSVAGCETLHFDYVAALILQRGGHFIESVLGLLAQHGLSRPEKDFGLRRRLILIDVGDHLLDRVQARVCLLRSLLSGLRFVVGIDGMLIGLIRLGRSQLDSLLRARIGIFDRLAVRGRQLIEFVDAVADGLRLARDVFLARKWVQVSPEALASFRLQGFFASSGLSRRLRR